MDKLTVRDAMHLADIIRAAQRNQKVALLQDDDTVVKGTARSIGGENFERSDEDIRSLYLRVTTETGFEVAWSIAMLMDKMTVYHFLTGV